MATRKTQEAPPPVRDHRVEVAEKKRLAMRARLVDATMRVFASQSGSNKPVIDDVIREAAVSRGTFYNYFDSLEDVLELIGHNLSDQMTMEAMAAYAILEEPVQRFAVGFRLFLTRAILDRSWAGFVTVTDAWARDTLLSQYMVADLKRGKERGQFQIENVDMAADFLRGASAHGILALHGGMPDPVSYVDAAVRMALVALGCTPAAVRNASAFSKRHLRDWIGGKLDIERPQWALNIAPEQEALLLKEDMAPSAARKKSVTK